MFPSCQHWRESFSTCGRVFLILVPRGMTLISSTQKLLCQVLLGLLQSLLQEADVSGCGGVLKPTREAETCSFLLWFHCRLVQEKVGIDVVDLKPNTGDGWKPLITHKSEIKKREIMNRYGSINHWDESFPPQTLLKPRSEYDCNQIQF